MNFLKKSVIAIIGMSLMMTASLFAQDYLDNALYVKFKETSSVSAKKFQRDIVPIEYLNLKISDKKMIQNGFHREARSMSLFDNAFLDHTFQIRFDNTVNIDKIIRLLEKDPNVELVERVPVFQLFAANPTKAVPNDPYYQPIDGKEMLWYLKMVNAEGAWDLAQGDPDIKVAVVDGAVWGEHPDLQIPSNLQYDAYYGKEGNSAPDHNKELQNTQCTTLYSSDPNVDPCLVYTWSHGTHCAGVVGAKNNNNIGISSLAGGVTLMGIRATTSQWPGSVANGYEGIRWATKNGANVISCSWGGNGNGDVGNAMLKECYEKNIVIVAAAGNDNSSQKIEPGSSMYVICVGSVDENKTKSSFSNYGTWVDILAPGGTALASNGSVGIISSTYCQSQSLRLYQKITQFDNQYYDEMSGTSMATPLVASLCALMLSKDSTLTPAQIKDILQNTSQPALGSFFTPLAGIIDAEAALKAIDEAKFDSPVENLSIRNTADTVWLQWEEPIESAQEIVGYRIYCNGNIIDSCTQEKSIKYYPAPSGQNVFLVSVVYKDGFVSTRKEARTIIPQIFQISVVANPEEGGTVSGDGSYVDRSMITLKAIPNEGYKFLNWTRLNSSTVLSTQPSYTFRVSAKATYVATFVDENVANEQTEGISFSLTPNPAREQVKISSPALINRISVVDLQGRTVKQLDNVNAIEYTLDVQDLENGTYVISLQTQSGNLQQKFVKL